MSQGKPPMTPDIRAELQAELLATRAEWRQRLEAIEADRRRASAPLVSDADDQAIQRENDESLDALYDHGRQEIAAIESALARLEDATFGKCLRCGGRIPSARLRAQPTAETCLPCATMNTAT